MIKRVTNITLLIVFLVTSTGFTITRHYCCNKLVAVSLGHIENCCTPGDCCHNKFKHIKITDSFESSTGIINPVNPMVFSSFLIQSDGFVFNITRPTFIVLPCISPPYLKFDNSFLQVFRN